MRRSARRADTTVIIPQFGQPELTCACIASLRQRESADWPIVVVDDGSAPECMEAVLQCGFSRTTILRQEHAGITAAWNRGMSHVETPIVLFLNNDVLFDGPIIARLTETLRQGAALICGTAWRRERMLPASVLRRLSADRFLQGWCFAARAETVRRLGGFDGSMKLYWSDTDFQARAAAFPVRQALACCPNLPICHFGHRTAHRVADRSTIWRADREAFIRKWSTR